MTVGTVGTVSHRSWLSRRDSPKSPDSSEGHNSYETGPNETSKVSIGIYATSTCR